MKGEVPKNPAIALWEVEERIGQLLPSQREFIFAPEMHSMISGGYASGKTRACCTKGVILSATFPGNIGMVGRYRATDLEDSVIPVFMEVLPPSWIKSWRKHSVGNATVTLRNASQIMFRHIHDPKAATGTRRVGANLGWFFISQAEEIQEEHWNAMIGRLRLPRAKKRFGFGDCNPNGHDWIWHNFFPGFVAFTPEGPKFQIIRQSSRLGIAVNSEENRVSRGGFVDDSYFDSLLQNYPKEWIDRYIYCSFDDFSGKIYKAYNAGLEMAEMASVHNIDPFAIPSHWDLVVGIDVGGESPWAVIPNYVDEYGNTIVADGFVQGKVATVGDVAAWIKGNLPWNESRTRFVIDWENRQAMIELAEHGIHCQPADKSVLPGILRVQGYFHINTALALPPWYEKTQPVDAWEKFRGKGSPRTFVFKTFKAYRKDHDEYVWNPNKTNTPLKTKTRRFDTCDADRYAKVMRPEASKLKAMVDKYADLRVIDELSAKEWTQFDKRIALRTGKMNGSGALKEADMEEALVVLPAGAGYDW